MPCGPIPRAHWDPISRTSTPIREPSIRSNSFASTAGLCLLLLPATSGAVTVTAAQSPATVRPGQTAVAILRLDFTRDVTAVTIRQVTLTNRTTGPGTQAQIDAELGSIRLYLDDGDGVLEPGQDGLLGLAVASGGKVTF